MKEYRNHHYIPECYLTNFTEDGKGIWVYDKKNYKTFLQSISNIFFKKDFYRINEEDIPDNLKGEINPLSLEKDYFANEIESKYNDFLKSLIPQIDDLIDNNIRNACLSEEDIHAIALFLVFQFLRTPKAREEVVYVHNNTMQQIVDKLGEIRPQNDFVKAMKLQAEMEAAINYPPVILHASRAFANDQVVKKITEDLVNNIWQIYVSPDDYFYSSDNPIIIERTDYDNTEYIDMGLNSYGVVVSFPLTKKILVRIFERRAFHDLLKQIDRRIVIIDYDFVKSQNKKCCMCAGQFVVSPINNYETTGCESTYPRI